MANDTPKPPRQRRGMGRVTLQDVAQAAGCTAITVSRFLREPERVAPDTADRVRKALAAVAYVPNKQAGGLASGHSGMVAALIPSIANSIFAETVQGLSDTLQAAGLELMLASTGYSQEREEEQVRTVLGWAPAALVITGRHHTAGALAMLQRALAAGTPVLEIWDLKAQRVAQGVVQVGFNHEAVGRATAQRLLAQGHRQLAYVDSGVAEDYRAHERGAGFVAEVHRAGGKALLLRAGAGDAFDAGRHAVAEMLDAITTTRRPRLSAAAFANDHLACGALLEAQKRGLSVPQRLALVGFGDFPMGRQLEPGLSTIRLPRQEIGQEAARVLVHMLQHRTLDQADVELPWQWVERGSTAAPAP